MKEYSWAKSKIINRENITETDSADIIIIGAGHAGTCAARATAENGASVIVLEQQPEDRQFILGIGEIGCINSKWQREHGVKEVDIDEFVEDWQKRTGNRSNVKLIYQFARESGDCFDWFIEPLNIEEKNSIHPIMTPESKNFPETINGYHAYSGSANMGVKLQNKAIKANQNLAKENGANFYFSTKAVELVKDKERITGVIARDCNGEYRLFKSNKGVILAAGDYSKNEQMCRELLTEAADLIDSGDWSGHGWDGSGIIMGVNAGARLEPRSHAALGGNYSFPGFGLIGSTATLRVNKHGKRYSNEGFATHILAARPGAKQPNGINWSIFDSNILEEITYQPPNHGALDYTDRKEMERLRGILEEVQTEKNKRITVKDVAGDSRPLVCADTIEELAKVIFEDEEDRKNLISEVHRYNKLCREGRDTDFGKDKHLLHPIQKAPFYAYGNLKDSTNPGGQSLKLLVTVSGLLIDENQQVLGSDFEPIAGLYATGNCSGERFGSTYTTSLPGQSISIAQTLGRAVGRYVANLNKSSQ